MRRMLLLAALAACNSKHQPLDKTAPTPTPARPALDECEAAFAKLCDLEKVESPGGQRCIQAHVKQFPESCLHKLAAKGTAK